MKWPIWKQVVLTTAVIAGLWLMLSVATTVYIGWLDRGYRKLLSENVTSIRAASQMQDALWHMHRRAAEMTLPMDAPQAREQLAGEADRFEAGLALAQTSAHSEEERAIVASLGTQFEAYLQLLVDSAVRREQAASPGKPSEPQSLAAAASMSADCNRLRKLNQALIEAHTASRDAWSIWVDGTRVALSVLGPVVGIWAGFRVARRLRRRLAKVSVRLEGMAGELGQLQIATHPGDEDFDAVDRQVQALSQRFADVAEELQTARGELVRNERLAAVGQLAAGVAHELRNPLTAVKLLVQTTAKKAGGGALTPRQLTVIQDEVGRMERTIQSLLDFARPPKPQRVPHDLRETLRRAINLVQGRATQDQIVLQSRLPKVPLTIDGDPEQLHQVFLNLLLNAMDASATGGAVTVALDQAEGNADARTSPRYRVTVTDDGPGIPGDVVNRLFEPFVTTKERGTGLGLAVSHRIIREHGGALTAANRPRTGAEFAVELVGVPSPG